MWFVMIAGRQLTLPAHGAIELLLGLATGVLPFLLGLGAPATVGFLVAAALLVTVALDGGITDERGLPALPPLSHRGMDITLVVVLAIGAVAAALGASTTAGLGLLGIALAELILLTVTRYAAP
jgi:hypothetical protein